MSAPSERPAPAQKREPPLAIGARVADKYKIESLVGEGGMGFVFAATHEQLGHRVALKVLPSSFLTDKDVTERFLREGRALARLQGEHIARVTDVGTLATGEPYLVMEFLEGRDLAKELAARGPLPLEETADFLAQSCEALAEAHVRGIIHRDLKPANLFLIHKLDGEACIKVLDFGISKIAPSEGGAAEDDNITVTSTIVGTPKYMSPEQIQDSRSVDARTDIWGLGTILYELLTQKRPFAAPSLALVCVKVLQEEPPPPSAVRADLPPEVDAVVARCLKKEPAERFANVGELASALAPLGGPGARASAARVMRILRSSQTRLGPDSSGSTATVGLARTPSSLRLDPKDGATLTAATVLEPTGAKKKRASRWLALAAAIPVAGAIAFFAFRGSKPEHAGAPAPSETHAATVASAPASATAPPAPTASEATSAIASASAAPPASTHVAVHHPPAFGRHVHLPPRSATADPGAGDVLEDRR